MHEKRWDLLTQATPERPTGTQRMPCLDLLKCMAILFVLCYHFSGYSYDFMESGSALCYVRYFFRTILSTCVPVFFFVHGYLLFPRELVLRNHIRKTLRFVCLAFCWSGIYMALIFLLGDMSLSPEDALQAILDMDPAYGINIFWYLGALVCVYLLYPAFKALFDTDKRGFLFVTAACGIVTIGFGFFDTILQFSNILADRFLPGISWPDISMKRILFQMFNPFLGGYGYIFVYFCMGAIASQVTQRILAVPAVKRNAAACFCVLLSCVGLYFQGLGYSRYVYGMIWDVVWCGYDTVFTLCNVWALFVLSLNYQKEIKMIRVVSKHTLGIYFLHMLIGGGLYALCSEFLSFAWLYQNILFGFLLLTVCLLATMGMKKIPVLRKLI